MGRIGNRDRDRIRPIINQINWGIEMCARMIPEAATMTGFFWG
jgi:hypothetical protein